MACAAAYKFTMGDSRAVITAIVTDNGVAFPVNLATGVQLRVRSKRSKRNIFNGVGAVVTGVVGKVKYEFTGTEFDESGDGPGTYQGQWVITYTDGQLTFPAGDEGFEIEVTQRF